MAGEWRARLQGIGGWGVVSRFPVPVFCAFVLSILIGLLIQANENRADPWPGFLLLALRYLAPFLVAVFLYSFALKLYSEASGRRVFSHAALVAGIALLAVAFKAHIGLRFLFWPASTDVIAAGMRSVANARPFPQLGISHACVLAALAFLPTVLPFFRYDARSGAFWQFNHKFVVSLLAALFGAGLAFAGVSAIIFMAKLLFGITINPRFMGHFANIACTFGAPLILLALVPADFQELPRTGSAKEFTSRGVSLLVRFILIPLVSVLSLMLAAYVLQVLWQQKFSEAKLGQGGLLYGLAIAVTALLAYPDSVESRIARSFMRAWPWFLIPPTILFFPSIWVRISEYGWTLFRYFVFAAGLWMALAAAAGMRWRYELRTGPGLLVLFFMLAAFGPWSAAEVTGRSQARQLQAFLTEKGMVAEGKWLSRDTPAWLQKDRVRVASMLGELETAGQLHRLEPWFEGVAGSPPFGDPQGVRRWFESHLNLTAYPLAGPSQPHAFLVFETPRTRVFRITNGGYLVGPINKNSRFFEIWGNLVASPIGALDVSLDGSIIEVRGPKGQSVKFDLSPLFSEIEASPKSMWQPFEQRVTLSEPQMRLLDGKGNFNVKAAIAEVTQDINQNSVWAEFFLILPAAP